MRKPKLYYAPSHNMVFVKKSYAEAVTGEEVRDLSRSSWFWFDPRPMFPNDVKFLMEAAVRIDKGFSFKLARIVRSSLTLVNAVDDPVWDHVLEFIVNGEPLCRVNFELSELKPRFTPSKLATALMLQEGLVGEASKDLEVKASSPSKFYAVTDNGKLVGVAVKSSKGGLVLLEKWDPCTPEELLDKALNKPARSWREVYEANEAYVENQVEKTKRAVEWLEEKLGRKGWASFSGGKDSLLSLCLLAEAGSNAEVVYATAPYMDPGYVRDYVEKRAFSLGFKLHVVETPYGKLKELFDTNGLPCRGNRWCTMLLKLVPMFLLARELYGLDKIVSYSGSRKYETPKRSLKPATYVDVEAGVLTHAVPYKFPKLLVYLTLWYRYKQPLVPDYFYGIERQSCTMCPHKTCYEIHRALERDPDAEEFWKPYALRAVKALYGDKWRYAYRRHFWRFYLLPRDALRVSKSLGLEVDLATATDLVTGIKWKVDQVSENYFRASFKYKAWRTAAIIDSCTRTLGFEASFAEGKITVKSRKARLEATRVGRSIVVEAWFEDEEGFEEAINAVKAMVMATDCNVCGHCMLVCKSGTIQEPFRPSAACISCRRCVEVCLLARNAVNIALCSKLRGLRWALERLKKVREERGEQLLEKAVEIQEQLYKAKEQNFEQSLVGEKFWEVQ